MLVLSRKEDQSIVFPNLGITVEIVRVHGNKVSVGVAAPKAIRIVRGELQAGAYPHGRQNGRVEDGSSDFQLGQFIELLAPDVRRELRSRLNDASQSVHAAQHQFELGGLDHAESFLSKALDALAHLNKMFESPLPNDSANCIKENRPAYGHAAGDNCNPMSVSVNDRGLATWFTKIVPPHQLVEYLQEQLCSSN